MKKNNMIKSTKKKETMTNTNKDLNRFINATQFKQTQKENIAIKPISKNNVILQKGDKCIFSTLTYDYPNLKLDQKITIADVYDNGVVCVDNGTNIQVNVLANQIDKI
jgi:hypothetical protein